MNFLTWTKHLMRKDPIRVEEEKTMGEPCPTRGKRECPRFSFDAPLEYSTTGGSAIRGAYTGNVSAGGLLVYSIDNLQVGTELRFLVFYPDEYRLDNFQGLAKVVWEEYHYEKEWKGFKYGLQFVYMSEIDRGKLSEILKRALIQENNLWKQRVDLGPKTIEAMS